MKTASISAISALRRILAWPIAILRLSLADGYCATYALFSVVFITGLIWAFAFERTFFPIGAWSMFSEVARKSEPFFYFRVSGRLADGRVMDLPPNSITPALSSRTFMYVQYTFDNRSLHIDSPHPDNVRRLSEEQLKADVSPGLFLPDVLRAWGTAYNDLLASNPQNRLDKLVLVQFEGSGEYGSEAKPIRRWEVSL